MSTQFEILKDLCSCVAIDAAIDTLVDVGMPRLDAERVLRDVYSTLSPPDSDSLGEEWTEWLADAILLPESLSVPAHASDLQTLFLTLKLWAAFGLEYEMYQGCVMADLQHFVVLCAEHAYPDRVIYAYKFLERVSLMWFSLRAVGRPQHLLSPTWVCIASAALFVRHGKSIAYRSAAICSRELGSREKSASAVTADVLQGFEDIPQVPPRTKAEWIDMLSAEIPEFDAAKAALAHDSDNTSKSP